MKNILAGVVLSVVTAQISQAADLLCGANIESTKGTNVYDKSLYLEKTDLSKTNFKFLLADGTILRAELSSAEEINNRVTDGTLWMGITRTKAGRIEMMSGVVARNEKGEIRYTNLAFSSALKAKQPLLVANGIALSCGVSK